MSFTQEHEEGRLENVFGFMRIAKDTQANAIDHPAVTPEQALESGSVLLAHKTIEELAIRQSSGILTSDGMQEMVDQGFQSSLCHQQHSLRMGLVLLEPSGRL